MLRNNVVVTEESINPDPVGYVGNIGPGLTLLSSHNAVFCDPGDEWGGLDDIRGAAFAQLGFADLPPSFLSYHWIPGSPNPLFLAITGGPLHTAARLGVNLPGGSPDPDDQAVLDDWEREPRPAGAPPHTDRGADQLDAEFASSVEAASGPAPFDLTIRPIPSAGPVEIALRPGELRGSASVRILDAAGRLVRYFSTFPAGASPRWRESALPPGVYFVDARIGSLKRTGRFVILPGNPPGRP